MSNIEFKNPSFRENLRIAFSVTHCFIFLGIPLFLTIIYRYEVWNLDIVYILFMWAFSLMFILFRLRLAMNASDTAFFFSGAQLQMDFKGKKQMINKEDVQQVIISEPLIILRIKSGLLDSVVHIIILDHQRFKQVSSLPFFRAN